MKSTVIYVLVTRAGSDLRAQVWKDESPQTEEFVCLTEYSEAMQRILAGAHVGARIVCEFQNNPTPRTLKPLQRDEEPNLARPFGEQGGMAQGPRQPGARSPHTDNPYNFAEWEEHEAPWCGPRGDLDKHNNWAAERLSGRLHLTIEARTPVLVPVGDTREVCRHG
jgi:hypothetical protein